MIKPFALAVIWLLATAPISLVSAEESTPTTASDTASAREVIMYKSPTCGCCGSWADHLRKAGFTVVENKRDDMDGIKSQYGVPDRLASCHTAIVDGYIIEGHVPATDVERLLKERPNVVGLTAPGMPMNAPGMQDEGLPARHYDVLSFNSAGQSKVFTHYK